MAESLGRTPVMLMRSALVSRHALPPPLAGRVSQCGLLLRSVDTSTRS